MKAKSLITGASFGPDAVKTMGQAFDAAWRDIECNFGTDAQDVEKVRLRLANALLSVATEDSRDVEALKKATLEAMALNYRKAPSTPD